VIFSCRIEIGAFFFAWLRIGRSGRIEAGPLCGRRVDGIRTSVSFQVVKLAGARPDVISASLARFQGIVKLVRRSAARHCTASTPPPLNDPDAVTEQ
jgi:hypothetical protein